MDLYDKKMVINTNLKNADTSLNSGHYNGTKFKKNFNSKISKKNSHSRGMKCQPKANSNRETVVVCTRHVVKRPSKRMR